MLERENWDGIYVGKKKVGWECSREKKERKEERWGGDIGDFGGELGAFVETVVATSYLAGVLLSDLVDGCQLRV